MPKPHAVRWASHLETLLPSATRTRHTIRNHAMVIITTFGVQYVQKSSICSGVFSGKDMMCEYPQCVMAYPTTSRGRATERVLLHDHFT